MIRRTSIEAYNTIKENGMLSKARWLIYDVLFQFGPLTRSEIDHRLNMGCYKSHVSARLCEMRSMGVVYEIRERLCTITGMNVIEWDCTDKLPVKFDKPVRHKCEFCDGKGYYEEQQARLF